MCRTGVPTPTAIVEVGAFSYKSNGRRMSGNVNVRLWHTPVDIPMMGDRSVQVQSPLVNLSLFPGCGVRSGEKSSGEEIFEVQHVAKYNRDLVVSHQPVAPEACGASGASNEVYPTQNEPPDVIWRRWSHPPLHASGATGSHPVAHRKAGRKIIIVAFAPVPHRMIDELLQSGVFVNDSACFSVHGIAPLSRIPISSPGPNVVRAAPFLLASAVTPHFFFCQFSSIQSGAVSANSIQYSGLRCSIGAATKEHGEGGTPPTTGATDASKNGAARTAFASGMGAWWSSFVGCWCAVWNWRK
ncbi:hypothetical protein C8R45DRAFT_939435 [Mycena sanguinolenta]|nr:hypothetical protein C8R45DRAFT_939435 [Mycena sanguinolenta]